MRKKALINSGTAPYIAPRNQQFGDRVIFGKSVSLNHHHAVLADVNIDPLKVVSRYVRTFCQAYIDSFSVRISLSADNSPFSKQILSSAFRGEYS